MARKKSVHYVDNAVFLEEMIKYKNGYKKSISDNKEATVPGKSTTYHSILTESMSDSKRKDLESKAFQYSPAERITSVSPVTGIPSLEIS